MAKEAFPCYTELEYTRKDTFLRDLSVINDATEGCVKDITENAKLAHDSAYHADIFVRMDALANLHLIQIALQRLTKRRVIIVVYSSATPIVILQLATVPCPHIGDVCISDHSSVIQWLLISMFN